MKDISAVDSASLQFPSHWLPLAGGVVLLLVACAGAAEPVVKTAEVTIPRTRQVDVTSQVDHRVYRLFMAEPTVEKPAAGYPVIYLLDANAYFATLVETARMQQRLAGPAVVVGVGYPGVAPFDHARRYVDFTPKTPREVLQAGLVPGTPPTETGGQEEFLRFLCDEVKPLVERQFSVDRTRQALIGHSLGGLFVLHVLFTRPESFQTYIASSPSIWWNERSILVEEQAFTGRMAAKGAVGAAGALRLLVSVGELEQTPRPGDTSQRAALLKRNRMVDNARELCDRLQSLGGRGLRVTFTQFEGENHGSVVPMAISRAVRLGLRPQP